MAKVRRVWLAVGAFIAVGAAVATAAWFLQRDTPSGGWTVPGASLDDNQSGTETPGRSTGGSEGPRELSSEGRLENELRLASTDTEKLESLARYARSTGAVSTAAPLQSVMLGDRSQAVRVGAFNVAKELATREGDDALVDLLKFGMSNPHPDVRQASAFACRDYPRFDLRDALLQMARSGNADRHAAIQGLAFLDDPEAQQVVLETAKSVSAIREERLQAIALLSRTRLPEGRAYLEELEFSEDAELRQVAVAALQTLRAGR